MLSRRHFCKTVQRVVLTGVLILPCLVGAAAQESNPPPAAAQPTMSENVDLLAGVIILNPGAAEKAGQKTEKRAKKSKPPKPPVVAGPVETVAKPKLVRSAAPVRVEVQRPKPEPRRPKRRRPKKNWADSVFNTD